MKKLFVVFMSLIFIMCLAGCDKENKVGNFHTLKEAYDKGLLNKDDLENIAYYYNDLEMNDFNPKPKDPDVIDKNNK